MLKMQKTKNNPTALIFHHSKFEIFEEYSIPNAIGGVLNDFLNKIL